MTNPFAAQPLQFRLQAAPALAPVGDKANLTLLDAEAAAPLPLPAAGAAMPGAPASRTDFDKPLDLLHHRALAVRLRVEGPALTKETCAVLNVQLESSGKTYRDHCIDLDFTGEKTVLLPEPTTERLLPEFRPAQANYAFKAAIYGFDYRRIVALNLRWMRWPKGQPVQCRVALVEALAESEVPLKDAGLAVGDRTFAIPRELRTGEYAEFTADGPVQVFDRNGAEPSSFDPPRDLPILSPGANQILLRAAAPASAKLTTITTGEVLSW